VEQVIGLFPTPFMRVPGLLGTALVDALVDRFTGLATRLNSSSGALAHTELLRPGDVPALAQAAQLIAPKLIEFGTVMFGERLAWTIKEMWVNVLETGGHQAMHNHANSFISAVLYLTPSHRSAQTVFIKSPGGTDFVFSNRHRGSSLGPFNADKWIAPEAAAGDLVLFPSWLLHEVPVNQGSRRISLALNAIPDRLDSWGYRIAFSA
jgi:Putative 2OG-Fe(II) oxygenase